MADPVLYPLLALSADSDVSADVWALSPWNAADSDVADWPDSVVLSKVSGQLLARGIPVSREILVLSAEPTPIHNRGDIVDYHVLANVVSGSDGSFEIQWSDYTGNVVVIYLDDLGSLWLPDTGYIVGDIVYPTIWNGWQYECVTAGTTDSAEPLWWHDEESTGWSGSAVFKARQYLPAIADGPLAPSIG